MLETPHIIVGATIAAKVANPYLSIPLAFGSHFLLDKVPHWNPHLNTEIQKYGKITKRSTQIVIIDVVLSVASLITIAYFSSTDPMRMSVVLLGGFAGVLPDVIEGPYFFFHLKSKFIKKWISFQKSIQTDTSMVPGLITQVVTILASIVWLGVK